MATRAKGADGGATSATPVSLEQAISLASTPSAISDGSSTTPVDASTALAAASQPDAQTTIESGMSPQSAVGLTALNDGSGVGWRAGSLIGGGVGPGFTYFTNRASAGFSCQTIVPWITLHTTHHWTSSAPTPA